MHDPAERSDRTDPRDAGEQEPQKAYYYSPVIDLPDPGDQETQQASNEWITHIILPPNSITMIVSLKFPKTINVNLRERPSGQNRTREYR